MDNLHDLASSLPVCDVPAAITAQTKTRCCIDHLPTETLEAIFLHRARDYFNQHDGQFVRTAPDWVHVSYVSRNWRNIALNYHSLWSYLFITSPRWTEELLARSKQAPLKLNVKLYTCAIAKPYESRFLAQVLDHLERIEELRVDVPFKFTSQRILSKLSSPAPCLRLLEADCFWSRSLSVPFNGDTPMLERLELRSCPVAWYSFNLSHLTSLSLLNVPHLFQQNMSGLLTTLGYVPNLEHLNFIYALPSAGDFLTSTVFRTFQKIELPHLSFIHMPAPLSTIVAFFSCVHLPSKARVELCWYENEEDPLFPGYCTTFNSLIRQRFAKSEDHGLPIPPIRLLDVMFSERRSVVISFSTSERNCGSSDNILELNIPFSQAVTMRDGDYTMGDIFFAVPLSNVQSLRIHIGHSPLSAFWKDLLGYLPNLRHIKLSNAYIPGLSSMLSVAPRGITKNMNDHDGADEDRDRILVPGLEELQLSNIIFDHEKGVGRDPLGHSEIRSLCDALASRKEPRGRFIMFDCARWNSEGEKEEINVIGWWGGGHFRVSTIWVATPVDGGEGDLWWLTPVDGIAPTVLVW